MPLYGYKCEKCGHEFSEVLSIAERNRPVDEDCPSCDSRGHIVKQVAAPLIASSSGKFHSKIPDGFKDRLKDIKKAAGRTSTIDV